MDAYQRRRRIQFWLGSFPVLVGFTVLILALILASQEATLIPQELDAVSFSQQTKSASQITNQKAAILAVSQ
ncbi:MULTISPECIES: hypothetical protein [Pseudomonas]|uniref:hypothetical protein n=1 Tax=Pseudomonas TaxID=286 RepID=UPI0012DA080C|nr:MULTISPECIES: hypothetical protein [Pseudomonas]WJM90849.1 hypothetical protein QDY63_26450 [Pseudomonas brenneri]